MLEEGFEVIVDKGFLIEDFLKGLVEVILVIFLFLGKSKGCNVLGGKLFIVLEVFNI